jgi:hypothetical protein
MMAALPKPPASTKCGIEDDMERSAISTDQTTMLTERTATDPRDVLEMTQAFVAVLLSGQAGALTEMQSDLLETIRIRVADVIETSER